MKNKSILKLAFVAFFAATICAGCFFRIPLGPVPIVLQNALCVLSGILLGGFLGAAPTGLFLAAGLIGLPVYSGGTGGLSVWAGPTGGFFPGYFIGAMTAGLVAGKPSIDEKKVSAKMVLRLSLAMFAGMTILYVPGVFHFSRWALKMGRVPADKTAFSYTLAACVLPYIPGDILKIAICVPVALKVRPMLAQYISADTKKNVEQNTTDE